jgi:mRNA interferase HigB
VRIISRHRLREFWESRKNDAARAERDLTTWHTIAKAAQWDNFAALKQTFGSADQVGNCVVFDVGNNRFRLIGRVNYAKRIIYVLRVMDHPEYDKNDWVDGCGCHKPPPNKAPVAKPAPKKRKASRKRKGRS